MPALPMVLLEMPTDNEEVLRKQLPQKLFDAMAGKLSMAIALTLSPPKNRPSNHYRILHSYPLCDNSFGLPAFHLREH